MTRVLVLLVFGLLLAFTLVFGANLSNLALSLYAFGSGIYSLLAEPVNNLRLGLGIPILGAFLLGLLAAAAPCQLSTNTAAIAWFAQDVSRARVWPRVLFFLVGKTLVYLVLAGVAVFIFGGTFSAPGAFFSGVRKALGPLMIIMGLYLLGVIRLPFPATNASGLGEWARAKGGGIGALLLGAAFGLAFCPTMFWLFFGLMLPTAIASSTGVLFPAIFALGTAVPLIIFLALWQHLGQRGRVLLAMRHASRRLGFVAGVLLLMAGMYDTLVYWYIW